MRILLPLLVIALAIWGVAIFNRLVRLRNQVRNAWADIDVQLTRRHDLVPQLVATVQAYASHEKTLLESVTRLRNLAESQQGAASKGEAEAALEGALGKLLLLHEAYPDLKASENFQQLQRDLVEVENHLQYARRYYNGAVRDQNNAVERFPDSLIASITGFGLQEFYQAGADERATPRADLNS